MDWIEATRSLGFPIVVCLMLLVGLWRTFRRLAEVLFDKETGYVTRWVNASIAQQQSLAESHKAMAANVEQMKDLSAEDQRARRQLYRHVRRALPPGRE